MLLLGIHQLNSVVKLFNELVLIIHRILNLLMHKIILLLSVCLLFSCGTTQPVSESVDKSTNPKTAQKSKAQATQEQYRATTPLIWDLIHTQLEVSFDLDKETVNGEATLILSPHFYPQRTLILDAKAFDIHEVKLQNDTVNSCTYKYTGSQLIVAFNASYLASDTVELFIQYTANPNEVVERSGKAIRGGQGLYFINAQNKIPNKPIQIWTQGETDFSSCWFPTLDEPNQKTSQEIAITVPDTLKTLSNGVLEFSTENGDGTRTDFWSQKKPHSPYLFMLAVGNFSVHKEDWRGLDVSYYTEPAYKTDAPIIFKNTPKMLEFYSNKLGVVFPWDKYAQVVVRDFVSGAMENTSATLHGEFVQRHAKELLDYPQDGIIAHELFHQWFGDLVSCESWSNLALNEAFATYGEYLWVEHSENAFEAQKNIDGKLKSYLQEAEFKNVDLVRFQYEDKLHMFDRHTYSKGACILHQLRNVIGDDAFFTGLREYLNRYAHSSAEMHQLRIVMEEVTGRDLNWFFKQWAFDNGHPKLTVTYHYDSLKSQNFLVTKQTQDLNEFPLYQLPIRVKTHFDEEKTLDSIWIKNEVDTFYLKGNTALNWVNFDSQNYLLAEVQEPNKTANQWLMQFKSSNNYRKLVSALEALSVNYSDREAYKEVLLLGVEHEFYDLRLRSLKLVPSCSLLTKNEQKSILESGLRDVNSKVRAAAVKLYRSNFTPESLVAFYNSFSTDSSYLVLSAVLSAGTMANDSVEVIKFARAHQTDSNAELKLEIAKTFAQFGSRQDVGFFQKNLYSVGAYKKSALLTFYSKFLIRLDQTDLMLDGYSIFAKVLLDSKLSWVKNAAASGLILFKNTNKETLKRLRSQEVPTESEPTKAQKEKLEVAQMRQDALETVFSQVMNQEINEDIRTRLEGS